MIDFIQAADTMVATGEAAAAAAEVTRMGLWELFMKGGWLMWPLLLLGGVTVFIFVERFMAIRKASGLDMNFMNRIRERFMSRRKREQLEAEQAQLDSLATEEREQAEIIERDSIAQQ